MPRKNKSTRIQERHVQDYLYISNDRAENADNFDPKWSFLRDMKTDKERYQAIRKRWENANIPNPQINLTCRQMRNQLSSDGNGNSMSSSSSSGTNSVCLTTNKKKKKKKKKGRCSRSCTRPYEQLISNLEKNFEVDYIQLRFRQKAELENMLQFHLMQCHALNDSFNFGPEGWQFLKNDQDQQIFHLLADQYEEVQRFVGERNENIVAYKKYIEEIKAFFTFYQRVNDNEITLQMTDEQYEHTVETERMYSLYNKFYG